MDKKLEKAMNEQINKEFYAAYLYLSMSAYFETKALSGSSSWMQKQAQEEIGHAMKFFNFVNDRGGSVQLEAVDKPPSEYSSVKDVFQKALKHEQKVSASINNLYNQAATLKDHAAVAFLSEFVTEQVEEEKTPSDILTRLEYIKEDSAGILMLDKDLGARVETA